MLSGWKLSVLGIIVVGATAVIAPLLGFMPFAKTVPLLILFVLFVGSLELMEWVKRKKIEQRKYKS